MPPYRPRIPQNVSEVMDVLGGMMLDSPRFIDTVGYFPGRNIDTVFLQLNEGLKMIRGEFGEELYLKLCEMSDRMLAHFEADPEDKTDETLKGRAIISEMMNVIDLRNLLDTMTRAAPKFIGYLSKSYIDTFFGQLNEALRMLRGKLGEERYLKLGEMSGRMRAHFEADPEDRTGETAKGRAIIREMMTMLKPGARNA
jgi:hypothetical protein